LLSRNTLSKSLESATFCCKVAGGPNERAAGANAGVDV